MIKNGSIETSPPATLIDMGFQHQPAITSSSKTDATRPASRSSSMQAESGGKQEENESGSKPDAKGPGNMSYSMDRWLSQKSSEEQWHGIRK